MLNLMSVVLYAVIHEKGKDVPCMDCCSCAWVVLSSCVCTKKL